MSKKSEREKPSRRDFLKLASISAPAVATAALTGAPAQAEVVEEAGEGIKDTAHTRAYYETARF